MATKLAAGKASRTGDSNPQYLGTKKYDGQVVKNGDIIIRQRGSNILAGKNVRTAQDYTLYSLTEGIVKFTRTRKVSFNGKTLTKKVVNVLSKEEIQAIVQKKAAQKAPATQRSLLQQN
jgi:large subunit ribosomal protein L27